MFDQRIIFYKKIDEHRMVLADVGAAKLTTNFLKAQQTSHRTNTNRDSENSRIFVLFLERTSDF